MSKFELVFQSSQSPKLVSVSPDLTISLQVHNNGQTKTLILSEPLPSSAAAATPKQSWFNYLFSKKEQEPPSLVSDQQIR
jgi:hypothetical protein